MTRKHFKMIADEIAKIEDKQHRAKFAGAFATIFKQINPKFDFNKFYVACGAQ